MITESAFIREARGHISNGWAQNKWDDGESCCVIGALERVAMEHLAEGGTEVYGPAKARVLKNLQLVFAAENTYDIPSLNDRSDAKQEDIEAALFKAELEAEDEEAFKEIDGE